MWIPLAELEEGETLQASAGPAIVLSVSLSRVTQPVYNIEVHGEHVYQVGELGVLVHNSCFDDAPKGILTGSLADVTKAERKFAQELLDAGKNVEVIPRGAGRTPDFKIDGVLHELKTLSGVVDQTSDGISKAIANRVMNGRGQAGHIIVDARGQAGITREIAERGIRRAFGADAAKKGIQSIRIIGIDFDIIVPRI